MDLKPWECQVCRTCYRNPDRRPRTLPCGHNFCTPCLHNVKANLVLCCPTCRASHTVSSTNELPINYDLEAVARTITNTAGMAKLDATPITPSETGHELDGVTETYCDDQGAKDDAKSKSQFNENNTLKEDTIAAVKSVSGALRKDRTPGLSRRLRASLKEQQKRLQESLKACQEVQEQLNQYRSALTSWTQEHKDLIKGLAALQQQNQQALQQLQNEDERVVTMQEEGQQDMNQLTAMLGTLDEVTTPQEAFTAANDADCYGEEAEEWRDRTLHHFPELRPVQQAAQIRRVTAAALSVTQSQPLASVHPNPDLDIMQKVRVITDSVASAQIGRGDVSTKTEVGVTSCTKTLTSPITSSTPSSGSVPNLHSKRALGQTDTSKTSLSPNSSGSGSTTSPSPKPDHSSQTSPLIAESKTSTTKTPPVPTPKSIPHPKTPSAIPASTTSTSTTSKSPPTDSKVTSKPLESSPAPARTSSEGSKSGSTDDFLRDVDVDPNSITADQLREMSARVRRLLQGGRAYAVRNIQGRVHSSRLTLKNDRVYLTCLSDQPPPHDAVTLQIGEAAGGLDVPGASMAFLELSWAGQRRGTVHISLQSNTPLAKQFILLCTGQLGHSFLNTNFLSVGSKGLPGEYIIAGDYEYNDGTGGAHLLPTHAGKYHKSDKAGSVLGWHTLGGEKSAQFAIITRDGMRSDGKKYINVFGEVESGMQALRLAAQYSNLKEVEIVDCGVVLNV